MEHCGRCSPEHPVLVDRYHRKEVEVDAICDGGKQTVIPGIMEHIERARFLEILLQVVYPPQTLTPEQLQTLEDYTKRLAKV